MAKSAHRAGRRKSSAGPNPEPTPDPTAGPTTDPTGDAADPTDDWEAGERRREFIEAFGVLRELAGAPRMEGRVLAYLMTSSKPYVSSAELAGALKASAGSISGTTRRLIELGFIARHAIPGDRSHYFTVDDDIWGTFLAGERRYLDRQRAMFSDLLADVPATLTGPRRRLRNARNYMEWLATYHRKMLADWKAYNETHNLDSDELGGGDDLDSDEEAEGGS